MQVSGISCGNSSTYGFAGATNAVAGHSSTSLTNARAYNSMEQLQQQMSQLMNSMMHNKKNNVTGNTLEDHIGQWQVVIFHVVLYSC